MREEIRPFEAADESAVVKIWHGAGRDVYTFLPTWQAFSLESVRRVFEK